jgi:CRP/FNR family transcriptional regulator
LHAGENPRELYIIKDGTIKVHDIDEQGNDKILHIMKPPAVFPLGFLFDERKDNESFYTPITDVDVYITPLSVVTKKLMTDGMLATYLLRCFTDEMHELLVRISSMEKTTIYERLTAALKFLGLYHAEILKNGWRRVRFPASHQLLADMVGATRERTTNVLQEFQKQHIIRYPRSTMLEIHFETLITQP